MVHTDFFSKAILHTTYSLFPSMFYLTVRGEHAPMSRQQMAPIGRWLNRSGGHPNLVVDFDGVPSRPVGRSMRRGADHAEPCSHATIVLKWVEPSDYCVLTSYPECRE